MTEALVNGAAIVLMICLALLAITLMVGVVVAIVKLWRDER
jgi:flagellar biosynthesis protein FliQ